MRVFAIAWVVLAASACSGSVGVGDRVVGRLRGAFLEGTATKVEPNLVTVQWDVAPPEVSAVPAGWVTRSDATSVSPGWALCRDGESWALCEVREAKGARALVATAWGEAEAEAGDALPVPPALAEWARREGPRQLRRAAATERMKLARPANAGGAVQPGTAVLAQWTDGNWWEGAVAEQAGANVAIDWLDGSHGSVKPEQVAALVPVGERAEEGMVALCRWQAQARWWRAVIERRRGQRLDVLYEDNTRGSLSVRDCVAGE